jgi:hypothetical protein
MSSPDLLQGALAPEHAYHVTPLGKAVWEVLGTVSLNELAEKRGSFPTEMAGFYKDRICPGDIIVMGDDEYDNTFGMFTAPGIPQLVDREVIPDVKVFFSY